MGNILYKGRTTNGDRYLINNRSMSCSDGHQGHYLYVFEADDKRALLLIFYIMSKMNVLDWLYRLDEKRIVFGIHNTSYVYRRRSSLRNNDIDHSKCTLIVRFFYKLCRYCRRDSLIEVLERTIDYHRNHNMSIYNAFFMAHFVDKIPYYANGMDIVAYQLNYTPNSIVSKEGFLHAFKNSMGYINYLYYYNSHSSNNINILRRGEVIRKAYSESNKDLMIKELNENEELRQYKEDTK